MPTLVKATNAQRRYLHLAQNQISFLDAENPPARGHRWSTHHACERRGWVAVNLDHYPHVISITPAGRAARRDGAR